MKKGGTVTELAIWDHCVHTQRCKLTPTAWEPLNVKEPPSSQVVLDMVVHSHSSFSQHMLKYTVACFPEHVILQKQEIQHQEKLSSDPHHPKPAH